MSLLRGYSIIPVFLCVSTSLYFFSFFIYWQKQQSHYSTTSPLPAMQPWVPIPNSVLSILLPLHRITAAQGQCFTSRSTHTSNCQCLSFYWVISTVMHCDIYLWARMLCSAHCGQLCQQEYKQESVTSRRKSKIYPHMASVLQWYFWNRWDSIST